jgi:hypothetical protein
VQCGEKGFSVVTDDGVVIKKVLRNTREWYLPEVDLGPPWGEIESPVFAIYLGQLWKDPNVTRWGGEYESWTAASAEAGSVSAMPNFNATENEKWQKDRSCAARYMGGPKDLFPNCTVVMETGRGSLEDLGRIVEYRGNRTMSVSPGGAFEVNGNFLGEGAYNAYKPFVYEGFQKYDMDYSQRLEGLDYRGNQSLRLFVGDEMLQFVVPNIEKFDGKNPTDLFWPSRYFFSDNITKNSFVHLLRYEVDSVGWEGNTGLAHNREYDYYGMPVRTPVGMSSTRTLSGFGTYVGTPHHMGNAAWGGSEFVELKGLKPDPKLHSFIFDVDPISGNVMRIAKRLQYSIRLERGPLMDKLISSQDRCVPPTAAFSDLGFGCFMYFPLMWYDDQRVFEEEMTISFYERYLSVPKTIAEYTTATVAFSTFLVAFSVVLYVWQWKRWLVFKSRIFLD